MLRNPTVRALTASAATLWITDATLAAYKHETFETLRSLTQGAAVTLSIVAALAWMRATGPARQPAPGAQRERPVYVSTNALTDIDPNTTTIKMPRMRTAVADVPVELLGKVYRMGVADSGGRRRRP